MEQAAVRWPPTDTGEWRATIQDAAGGEWNVTIRREPVLLIYPARMTITMLG